jgi:hypothetical protein
MRTACLLACFLVAAGPDPARGNGTFVAYTKHTSHGGITPLKQVKIRLTSETLRIKVGKVPAYTGRNVALRCAGGVRS